MREHDKGLKFPLNFPYNLSLPVLETYKKSTNLRLEPMISAVSMWLLRQPNYRVILNVIKKNACNIKLVSSVSARILIILFSELPSVSMNYF